jgi:hypothetical protein
MKEEKCRSVCRSGFPIENREPLYFHASVYDSVIHECPRTISANLQHTSVELTRRRRGCRASAPACPCAPSMRAL